MVTETYTSAIKLTEDTWKHFSKAQKEELLESIGANQSWAETKTIREMVSRGGGIVAKDLLNLSRKYLKSQGGKVKITWND